MKIRGPQTTAEGGPKDGDDDADAAEPTTTVE